MSNTLRDSLSSVTNDFFVNHVTTQLCDWLKTNKSVECTPQELCAVFNVSYTPKVSMSGLPQAASMSTQMPNLPGYYQGTGASPAPRKTGAGGGGRKKAAADPNAPKCSYLFQRGNKKGEVCGEPVAQDGTAGGEMYCKGCLKKKTVQGKVKDGDGGKSTIQPPIVPGGMVSIPEHSEDSSDNTIKAVPIEGHPDMFRDEENGWILRQMPDGAIVALAVEENGSQRPLNAAERKSAQLKGISLMDSPPQTVPTVVPTVPTIPQASKIPSVPSIPTIPSIQI